MYDIVFIVLMLALDADAFCQRFIIENAFYSQTLDVWSVFTLPTFTPLNHPSIR